MIQTVPAQSVVVVVAALAILAAAMSVGCSNQPGSGDFIGDTFDSITPPTPSEAARDAFNVYDADKRRSSVALLSNAPFGGEPPYVRVYRLLSTDVDPTVRGASVRALGLHGTTDDIPRLIVALGDEVTFVRWEAAKALQKIHSPAAIDPLLTALRDDADNDVRMAAATALAQYPRPQVFQALVAALDDTNFSVAMAASKSLESLTGQELGSDPRDWQAFGDQNPGSLFDEGQAYTWQPFERKRGVVDRTLMFWKDRPAPEPREPTRHSDAEITAEPSPDDAS